MKVNIPCYHRPLPLTLAQISASPHQWKQSLPLLTVCFIRSEKSQHQAFFEEMKDSGRGQINTRVNSRISTQIFYQNSCLIVSSCNMCTDPKGLGWGWLREWLTQLNLGWDRIHYVYQCQTSWASRNPIFEYQLSWNIINVYQELKFFLLRIFSGVNKKHF